MALFFPTQLKKNITEITAEELRTLGIQGVLLDIDNTLTEHNSPLVSPEVLQWLQDRKNDGFGLILVSNNRAERVVPFAASLGLPFTAKAKKPLPAGFRRAAEQLGLRASACAVIGDQIFTDIVGANLSGMPSVLLQPLAPERNEPFIAFKRRLERPVLAAYHRRQRRKRA